MRATSSNDNIWVAAGDGQLERLKELVEGGAEPNAKDDFGYTPIHAAVSYNHKEILDYLLNNGGDINVEDFDKDTPLYVCETTDMARFLLDRGADASHKNREGISPAQTANDEGWKDVAQLLASITGETIVNAEDQPLENDTLAYIQHESENGPPLNEEDDEQRQEEFAQQVEQVMQRIQQDGGVHDEDELRDVVTKMVLQEVKRSMDDHH
ncbi:ankyrin repeat-containing domain protein [Absidia repens]|uniref:Ankyrin repeat-containing domain protein n=1 Tax=Absidia repens TaxID=90262 RepID=A0A1X2IEE6_9FUNG|nr:ankyrin repeat-containing domain protein [Absidia repens]